MPNELYERPGVVFTLTVQEVVQTEYYVRATSEQEARDLLKGTKPALIAQGEKQVVSYQIISVTKES